jgi:hypothetical protein
MGQAQQVGFPSAIQHFLSYWLLTARNYLTILRGTSEISLPLLRQVVSAARDGGGDLFGGCAADVVAAG